jgi:4'-phosphopantetheinyl transferase
MDAPESLGKGEVHIWYVLSDEVRDPAVLARCRALMTPDEHARHDRFVFEKDRHQFLVTRGMIRTLVARYLGIAPAECVFETNHYGRPSLCGPAAAALGFNISHTKELIACALARVAEIGVDVEHAGRAVGLALARRFFAPSEANALAALPEAARSERFFDYWTLKEAYIKARGMGFSLPLDGFSIRLDAGGPPRIEFAAAVDDDPASWQFAQFRPTPAHRLALAVRRRGPDLSIRVRELVV